MYPPTDKLQSSISEAAMTREGVTLLAIGFMHCIFMDCTGQN